MKNFNRIERRKMCCIGLAVSLLYLLNKNRKRRRWWVRPININRHQQGDYHNLIQEMRMGDPEMFFNYTRLNIEQFDLLLSWIGPIIKKNSFREPIPPGARLALTLRHLASGDSIPTLSFSYRIGKSTVCEVINETCEAIWTTLNGKVLKEPSKEEWKSISNGFFQQWNLPNCLGAMDGKHVQMRAPYNSGSQYFNYKKTFSIVLFAVCDYKYCFTYVDIGGYGSQSDGGILRASSFGKKLNNNLLDLPEDSPFPNTSEEKPHYFVADEAFPLQTNLMRPYGGKALTDTQRIYNYRISRARRCIENSFGILVARFRIFHETIYKMPENVDKVIKACVSLHNFIKKQEDLLPPKDRKYCSRTYIDREINGEIISGEWRKTVPSINALRPVKELGRRIGARNTTINANNYREYIKDYCASSVGSVPWQDLLINK